MPKIFRIHVKLRQNLRQENCHEKICGFRKYPKFSPNFRNLAFHSSQIIISNILIHKCLIASPNLCQIVAPNGSLGSFCTKLLRQINNCDQSAPKMCAKFCSSRCSAPSSEIHPQIHPGKNVQADENIEIFVAPSASCRGGSRGYRV